MTAPHGSSPATETPYDKLLERLDRGANHNDYDEAFGDSWKDLCSRAASAIRNLSRATQPAAPAGVEAVDADVGEQEPVAWQWLVSDDCWTPTAPPSEIELKERPERFRPLYLGRMPAPACHDSHNSGESDLGVNQDCAGAGPMPATPSPIAQSSEGEKLQWQAATATPGIREALALAYHELKQHDVDYHYRTSIEVNNKIVDALGSSEGESDGGAAVEKILHDHFYTGEPGEHDAIKAAAKLLCVRGGAAAQCFEGEKPINS